MEVILAFATMGTSDEQRVDTAFETFVSYMSLVSLWWMLVISCGIFSPRNN